MPRPAGLAALVIVGVVASSCASNPVGPATTSFSAPTATVEGPSVGASDPKETGSAAPSAEPSTGARDLAGKWTTGRVPSEELQTAMERAGITADTAAGWVERMGAPSEFEFQLDFGKGAYTLSSATSGGGFEVQETGTYAREGEQLRLTVPEEKGPDEYVFDFTDERDGFRLRLVDVVESGTAEAAETHRLFTTAFYGSVPFRRTPR
jgi:hypothetical protein